MRQIIFWWRTVTYIQKWALEKEQKKKEDNKSSEEYKQNSYVKTIFNMIFIFL